MKEALEAIANFFNQAAMLAYCDAHGIWYAHEEPPYLTMGRIAAKALAGTGPTQEGK